MSISIRNLEVALVKTVRAAVGDQLSTVGASTSRWVESGTGYSANPNHNFTANSLSDTQVLRDSYFITNPSELIVGAVIALVVTGQSPIKMKYTEGKASVVRSRVYSTGFTNTTPAFPDYPYASVDYTRLTDEGYELTERYYNDAGDYVYQTHKIATFSIKFFGTSKDDVLGICNKMHLMLEMDGVRGMIQTLTDTPTALRSKSVTVFVAAAMEDKYREIASFDINLAVIDEVSVLAGEDGSEYIENVDFTTTLAQSGVTGGIYKNDTDKLDTTIKTEVTYP